MISTLAVRVATYFAILNNTIAEDRVFDSATDGLDQMVQSSRAPFVLIYTTSDGSEIDGRDLSQRERTLELTIEIAVADKVAVEYDDGETVQEVVIPNSDGGIEASLDFLQRQVFRCLTTDQGVWPDLWRELVVKIDRYNSVSGQSAESGLRFAARQITLELDTVSEPAFGAVEAGTVWERFVSALRLEDATGDFASAVEAFIVGDGLSASEIAAGLLGVSAPTMSAIGQEGDGVKMTDQEITDMEERSEVPDDLGA